MSPLSLPGTRDVGRDGEGGSVHHSTFFAGYFPWSSSGCPWSPSFQGEGAARNPGLGEGVWLLSRRRVIAEQHHMTGYGGNDNGNDAWSTAGKGREAAPCQVNQGNPPGNPKLPALQLRRQTSFGQAWLRRRPPRKAAVRFVVRLRFRPYQHGDAKPGLPLLPTLGSIQGRGRGAGGGGPGHVGAQRSPPKKKKKPTGERPSEAGTTFHPDRDLQA